MKFVLEVVLIVGLSFLLALQSPARVIQGPSEPKLYKIGQNTNYGDGNRIQPEHTQVFERKEELSHPCRACRAFMDSYREKIVLNKQKQLDFVNDLKKMCGFLPTDKEDACTRLAETATPFFIRLFSDALATYLPCLGMRLCPLSSLNVTAMQNLIPWIRQMNTL